MFPFARVAKKVSLIFHSFWSVHLIGIEKLPEAGQKKREALDKLMVVCPHCKCHEKRGLLEQHIVSACPTRLIFVIVCSWFSHIKT